MKKTFLRNWVMLLVVALAGTAAIPAHAQDRDDRNQQIDRDHDRDHDRDRYRDRWENRDQWDYRTYDGDHRPQGWRAGEQTQWSNCQVTGDGRHYKCYSYDYQGTPYYYYRDENGNVYMRRQHRDSDKDDYRRDRDDDRKDHDDHQ